MPGLPACLFAAAVRPDEFMLASARGSRRSGPAALSGNSFGDGACAWMRGFAAAAALDGPDRASGWFGLAAARKHEEVEEVEEAAICARNTWTGTAHRYRSGAAAFPRRGRLSIFQARRLPTCAPRRIIAALKNSRFQ
jgi:hypothetical protein